MKEGGRVKLSNFLTDQKGLTLIELLVSITILGILLLSFMNFFLQAGTYTNYNQKKTVGVNVARNVMMFMEKQSYLEMRNYFYDVNIENKESDSKFFKLYICNDQYKYVSNETPNKPPNCENIKINGLEYEAFIYSENTNGQDKDNVDYYIPLDVEIRWNINEKNYETRVEGTIKSEDVR